jgi:hypothetical protein
MKYLVLMYSDPAATVAMSVPDRATIARKHEALRQDPAAADEMLNGAGSLTPRTRRPSGGMRDGPAATDGPFTTAAEQLTAYDVTDCASPERARAIAERVLDFHVTAVEVRPVHDSLGIGGTWTARIRPPAQDAPKRHGSAGRVQRPGERPWSPH